MTLNTSPHIRKNDDDARVQVDSNAFVRLFKILQWGSISLHLKTGPSEYVELKASQDCKSITLYRTYRTSTDSEPKTQLMLFERTSSGPIYVCGRMPNIEKLLARIEKGERHSASWLDLPIEKRHRYKLEHPECFTQREIRDGRVWEYACVAKRISEAIQTLGKHAHIVRPGFQDITEKLIDSFKDALYMGLTLDSNVTRLTAEQKRHGGEGLYHHQWDLGHLTHSWRPLHRAIESIEEQLDVLQQKFPDMRELLELRAAALTMRSACDLFLESRQYRYRYGFRELFDPKRDASETTTIEYKDILELKDGRRVIVLDAPQIRDEGWRNLAVIGGIIINPSGLVESGTLVLSDSDSCVVLRSGLPWALPDAPGRRRMVSRSGRGAARVELLGHDANNEPYYLCWMKDHPFTIGSVTWVNEELSADRFTSFPVSKIESLLDAMKVRGFPPTFLPRGFASKKHRSQRHSDTVQMMEASPAPEGLEHLCRLMQQSERPVYLHVSGTSFPEDGFISCRLRDGLIVTADSEQQLTNMRGGADLRTGSGSIPVKLPEILARYPVSPILLVTSDNESCEKDIRLAREYGWSIIFFDDLKGLAQQYAKELTPSNRSPERSVQVVKRTSGGLHLGVSRAVGTKTAALSDPIVRGEVVSEASNQWVRRFDTFSHDFERLLCTEVASYVVHSEEETRRAAHLLRTVHKGVESIRRALLFHDLELSEWMEVPCTIEGLRSALRSVAQKRFDAPMERMSGAVDELRAVVERNRRSGQDAGPASFDMDTVITSRDLVRISEIMESGRNDIFGPAGALHGMMYGDMSPARFADFFDTGSSIVSSRDAESGTIQGFVINYPKWATLKLKGAASKALGEVDSTRIIAISINTAFKS